MWELEGTSLFDRRLKRYQKKHPVEATAVLNNLDTYLKTLASGIKPGVINVGWIHREPEGVVAIDQKGGGPYLRQTRLYLYANEKNETVYLISIGDKNSQKNDLKDCRNFIKKHRRSLEE